MNTKEAKDFLAEQTAEQASLDGVALSDLERRMMYFTESDPATCPDPIGLHGEFDAKCDTAQYGPKMWHLLHHAWRRLKKHDPARRDLWREAFCTLRKGDHYLLVLWEVRPPGEKPKGDDLKLMGTALAIVASLLGAALLAAKYHINLNRYLKGLPVAVVLLILVRHDVMRLLRRMFGSP